MDQSDVYEFLDIVLKKLFRRDDIVLHPKMTAKDVVGWDSFKQVEITLALEEKYDIRIRTRELNNVDDLSDLVNLVIQKVGAKA
jgi:acyl carrier protein